MSEIIFLNKLILRTPSGNSNYRGKLNIHEKNVLNEAIFLSSPSFYFLYNKNIGKRNKLKISYAKFEKRFRYRATPFGLHSSISIINWVDSSNIIINRNNYRRITFIEPNFFLLLNNFLLQNELLIKKIKFYPNPSYCEINDAFYFITNINSNKDRRPTYVKTEKKASALNILTLTKNGLVYEEILERLMLANVDKDAIKFDLNELISKKLLVSEFEMGFFEINDLLNFDKLLNKILKVSEFENLNQVIKFILEIKRKLKNIDLRIGNPVDEYLKIQQIIKSNFGYESPNLFHCDLLIKNVEGGISFKTQNQLKTILDCLTRLFPQKRNQHIEKFIFKYQELYQDNPISLQDIFQPNSLLSYPVEKIDFENTWPDEMYYPFSTKSEKKHLAKSQAFILNKLINRTSNKICISSEEIFSTFKKNEINYQDTFSVLFSIINNNQKVHFKHAGESCAASLISRFWHLDKRLMDTIKKINKLECQNNFDKVVAEFIHLPSKTTDNIIHKPNFRNYKIYYSTSPISDSFSIPLSDIFLIVKDNQLVLWSKKLNKEIIPKLSGSHNLSNLSMPLYKFIYDLQFHKKQSLIHFNWGSLYNKFEYFPRIEIDDSIVSPETWVINRNKYEKIIECNENDIQIITMEFRKQLKLPGLILFTELDNELLLNLNRKLDTLIFKDLIKNLKKIVIKEYLFDPKKKFVVDNSGNFFNNEFIALAHYNKKINKVSDRELIGLRGFDNSLVKSFCIGSDWLYYKIYLTKESTSIFIISYLKKIIDKLKRNNLIKKWFFVLYNDNDNHIRVRVNLISVNCFSSASIIFNDILNSLFNSKSILSFKTDMYVRELERYGYENIEDSEELFFYDSEATLKIHAHINSKRKTDNLIEISILNIDSLLNCFNLNLTKKKELISSIIDSYKRNYENYPEIHKKMIILFKESRVRITSNLRNIDSKDGVLFEINQVLKERSQKLVYISKKIKSKNFSSKYINSILISYLHMTLNRMALTDNYIKEFQVYDHLLHLYKNEKYTAKIFK